MITRSTHRIFEGFTADDADQIRIDGLLINILHRLEFTIGRHWCAYSFLSEKKEGEGDGRMRGRVRETMRVRAMGG